LFSDEHSRPMCAMDRQVNIAKRQLEFEFQAEVDGEIRTYEVIKFPIWDREGKFYAVGGFTTDITQRKWAEEVLQFRNGPTRRSVDSATTAIVKLDRQGRVKNWNAQASELFGWQESEVSGRKFSESAVSPADRAKFDKILNEFNFPHEKSLVQLNLSIERHNGHLLGAETTIMSVRDEAHPCFYILTREAFS